MGRRRLRSWGGRGYDVSLWGGGGLNKRVDSGGGTTMKRGLDDCATTTTLI